MVERGGGEVYEVRCMKWTTKGEHIPLLWFDGAD